MQDKRHNTVALFLFVVSAAILLALSIYTSLMMNSISTFLREDIQERLLAVSKLAAVQVTPEELAQLDSPDDIDTPLFRDVKERLITFAEENGAVFVYYLRRTDDGMYQFIIDNDTTEDTVNLASEPIGPEPSPELAYSGTAATSGLEKYSIGYEGLLSSYAPIYDRQGTIVAIAGVDINDDQILTVSRHTRNLIVLLIVSGVCVVISGLMNIFLRQRKERRLRRNLEQQELMSEISQSFISDKPTTVLIEDALCRTGRFLQARRCFITVTDDAAAKGAVCVSISATSTPAPLDTIASILPDMFPATLSEAGAISSIYCNDINADSSVSAIGDASNTTDAVSDAGYRTLREAGLGAFILTPIYLEGALWGVFGIEARDENHEWSTNDIQLISTVSSAIAGAVARDLMGKEREAALERAVLASRAKGDFLSNMSHEMRTPMNAIIGMSTIGLAATEAERKDYCLEKVSDASTHLLGIINDVLDMSKIEANKLELSYVSFDFRKMIDRVVNVMGFRVSERHQLLDIVIDDSVPRNVVTDDQRLAQVVTNLLSNAVKFTPEEGTISLSAHLLEEKGGLLTIQVEVSDTGIGISAEQQKRLFSSFEQADGGTARKFGGTGLGLAISKRIVELMGGSIWIESELGEGATFKFTIRVRRGKDEGYRYLPADVNWNNVRVLAVDDAEDTRAYFQQTAQRLGVHCDTVAGGEEALARIARAGSYDIYLVDWKIPDMSGIELVQRLKSRFGGDSRVVMVSAVDWSEIEEDALKAGVDRFLRKPLSTSSIADCFNEFFAPSLAQRVEADMARLPDFSAYRMLLAEDIEVNREIVLALLEPTGLVIECAENGVEALETFNADSSRYDFIFMDMQMPEMDGCEATRRIRALDVPKAQTVPIVAMTANVFREDIDNCLAAGMNDHVGKPLDLAEVITVLRKWLPAADHAEDA